MIRTIRHGSVFGVSGTIRYAGSGGWSVAKGGTGVYNITFNPPLPVANYAVQVQLANTAGTVGGWVITDSSQKTASGIVVEGIDPDVFQREDHAFDFVAIVIDPAYTSPGIERALWGHIQEGGAILGGTGFTVTPGTLGRYTITFDTPLTSSNYGISVTVAQYNRRSMQILNKTASGFEVAMENPSAVPADADWEFLVLLKDFGNVLPLLNPSFEQGGAGKADNWNDLLDEGRRDNDQSGVTAQHGTWFLRGDEAVSFRVASDWIDISAFAASIDASKFRVTLDYWHRDVDNDSGNVGFEWSVDGVSGTGGQLDPGGSYADPGAWVNRTFSWVVDPGTRYMRVDLRGYRGPAGSFILTLFDNLKLTYEILP